MVNTYYLTGYDEESNPIVELEVSADQAVEILAKALKSQASAPIAHVQPEATRPERKPRKNKGGRPRKLTSDKPAARGTSDDKLPRIIQLQSDGLSIREIAAKLGMSYGAVYQRLKKSPAGTGRRGKRAQEDIGSFHRDRAQKQPLTNEQYDGVREAMHDRDFQSAEYALSRKLSPAEVNSAVRSTSYEDYLIIR